MSRTLQGPGKKATTCSLGSLYASPSNAPFHKTWVPPYASGRLSVTLRPKSLSLLRASVSLPLSKLVARIPVSVSLHRAFWKPHSTLPSPLQTWPPPPSKSRSSPRPAAGRPGSVRSGARGGGEGALRGSAPPRLPVRARPQVITAGHGQGAGAGAESRIQSRVRRGPHLEAGGGSGEAGPRVPRRRLVPAGRAEPGPSELPVRVPAAHGLCGRVGARPQPLPEEVRAGPAPPGPRPRPPLPAGCGPRPGPASRRRGWGGGGSGGGGRPRPHLLFGPEPAPGPLGRPSLT